MSNVWAFEQESHVFDFQDFLRSREIPAIDLHSPPGAEKYLPFIPIDDLKSYLSGHILRNLLRCYEIHDTHWREIQERYLRVFTILFSIGKASEIKYFLFFDNLIDDRLPFTEKPDRWPDHTHYFTEFRDAQWKFCAYTLRKHSLNNSRLRDEEILPITSRQVLKTGTDSRTYLVEIHPSYNGLAPKDASNLPVNSLFVIKICRAKDAELHHNEVNAYRTIGFGDDVLPNMVQLYSSWVQKQEYCMIMEYVDGGTLEDFFCKHAPPANKEDSLQFWDRLKDIAKPLARIHRHPDPDRKHNFLEGIHNDIKTENILVTKSKGHSDYDVIFKIADLGLAKFASVHKETESRVKDTSGTQMFTAPEYFKDDRNPFHQRSIFAAKPPKDIWSLGCVFSEALLWSELGFKGLEAYRSTRKEATERIPKLRNSAHSGCFHDGEKVLQVVIYAHVRARELGRTPDHIVQGIIGIIENMLGESSRPEAFRIIYQFQQTLDLARAPARVPSGRLTDRPYPSIFRTTSETSARQLPEEMPPDFPADFPDLGIYSDEHGFHEPSPITPNGTHPTDPYSPVPRDHIYHSHERKPLRHSPNHQPMNGEYNRESRTENVPITQRPISLPPPEVPTARPPDQPSRSHGVQFKLPSIKVAEVNKWIKNGKKNPRLRRPLDPCLQTLDGRDQIFLVDNSASMDSYWSNVRDTIAALAYLVKSRDPDKMELYLTGNPTSGSPHKDTTSLLKKIDTVASAGQCDIGLTLGKILDDLRPGETKGLLDHLRLSRKKKWGVNIYVLTDGAWQNGKDWLDAIVKPLNRLIARGVSKRQLGIQFIQFGNEEIGTRRLEYLDNELHSHGVTEDMIDTEHWTGNVYKMLLGAINHWWDEVGTPEISSTATTTSPQSALTSNHHQQFPPSFNARESWT